MNKPFQFVVYASLMLQAQLALAENSPAAAVPESALAATFNDSSLKWMPCPPFIPKGCEIAVLHGDPSKPNVDVFFKVPENFTIPNHSHTSAERMVLVSGELTVTYEGQAPKVLKTGSYAYGPAKKPHSAVCANGAPCVLFIAFESPLDAIPTDGATK
ncbi:MAG: cupin domain-containing protein [Pseudomonadota bacterium]|nr:cupin domain-containing protein [Pseudomonadota bacterium]